MQDTWKKIKKYFNNGKDFGVNIDYYFEKPLGTAGSLSFLKTQSNTCNSSQRRFNYTS